MSGIIPVYSVMPGSQIQNYRTEKQLFLRSDGAFRGRFTYPGK